MLVSQAPQRAPDKPPFLPQNSLPLVPVALCIGIRGSGKFLESAAKGRTSAAITKLMRLAPPTATLVTLSPEGVVQSEEEIAANLIQRGDLLKVSSHP